MIRRIFVSILPLVAAVLMAQVVFAQPAQYSPPYAIRLEGPAIGLGYQIAGADTNIGNSFQLVSLTPLTQMSRSDTLRIISSSTPDSSNLTLYFTSATDSSVTYETLRVSGTDSVFGTKKALRFIGAVADTEAAGTIKILSKTGGLIQTILPGNLQTYTAHYFTQKYGSVLDSWSVQPDVYSPAMQVELRWYPDYKDAKDTPETGFRVLDRRTIGGVRVERTQVSKTIVTSANDTSRMFFLGSLTKMGYFAVTTSTGTTNEATYIDVSSDTTNWKQTNAIDSLTSTGITTAQTRARTINVDSLYGQPWGRLIVNGKGSAGDTCTISVFLTLKSDEDNRGQPTSWRFPYPLRLTNYGYLAVYARSLGLTGGRINMATMTLIDRTK